MKTITTLDLRKKLGSVLDDVSKNGKEIIISRANRPLAVMISIQEYEEKILKKNKAHKLKEISAKMDEWRRRHGKETAHIDVVKAIRQIRENR